MRAGLPRWTVTVTLVIGIALALAPVAFKMFERAPLGGDMIDDFAPYMTEQKIDTFRGYMDTIGAAVDESDGLKAAVIEQGTITADDYDTQFLMVNQLADGWDAIDTDMTDLLDRMDRNMGNYHDVAALPSFDLFPWFFVLPGVFVAGLSVAWMVSKRRWLGWALLAMGLGIVAAPAIFQMFTRAPSGGEMINDFRPMMTTERLRDVQGYFVTLGAGEGQLRVGAEAAYTDGGGDMAEFPALAQFSDQWPTILGEFNPMIATMGDNVDNFQAVDAMPSFPLFPWFFVGPGVLVAGLAWFALRRTPSPTTQPEAAA